MSVDTAYNNAELAAPAEVSGTHRYTPGAEPKEEARHEPVTEMALLLHFSRLLQLKTLQTVVLLQLVVCVFLVFVEMSFGMLKSALCGFNGLGSMADTDAVLHLDDAALCYTLSVHVVYLASFEVAQLCRFFIRCSAFVCRFLFSVVGAIVVQ
ncbi:hypothetical protein BU25DRAFT_490410 [Macroventuria anomochaeta]|uniref:Uncharacterized protein n=1 Tax=Macroventuria anomochaeta TaxID=301207 RepID=A0ACB6S5Z4_9PLEO|nr:uncharacterized protein BU25DRAFT_490410 [Macroventuria anomochaeta]KAF2628793.1 hypothetical protein BU25DRAFT_490410 [Macroventuria anomochaeta]